MNYFEAKKIKILKNILYIFLVVFLGGVFIFFLRQNAIWNMGLDNFILLMFFIFIITVFFDSFMFFHYYKYNKEWTLKWFIEQKKIVINIDDEIFNIPYDAIEYVEQVRTFPFAEERMQFFFTDSYNYSFVKLKNGKNFIITSLLAPRLEFQIEPDKIKLTKTFLCYIRGRHKM